MNVVALIGNVAAEPALRSTPSGKQVCEFRIAVSRPGGEQADFFSVITWERQAEICAEFLNKGRRVAVEGRLHHATWEASDGSKRGKVEVVANRVTMLGAKRPSEQPKQPPQQTIEPEQRDELAEVENPFSHEPVPV